MRMVGRGLGIMVEGFGSEGGVRHVGELCGGVVERDGAVVGWLRYLGGGGGV